jgi:tetratricopeptide (TPR) repeat protein
MKRVLAMLLALASTTFVTTCKKDTTTVDEAYKTWDAAIAEADTNADKVAATRSFLDRFPDSTHTADAAETLAYVLGEEMGKPGEADAYLQKLYDRVTAAETRTEILGLRLAMLGKLKDGARLRQAAEEYLRGREPKFRDRSTIAGAALDAGEWDLALSTAEAALPLASPDVVSADNPKRKLSEQRLADTARRRKVEMLGVKGWALANLGRTEDALAVLREAYDEDFHGYMGNTESSAGSYLGRALEMAGRHAEADAPLAVAALYGGDEEARKTLRARYPTTTVGDQALDAFLAEERTKLARVAADFTLPDYAGAPHAFSTLRNGEVTLLSFWFPT